MHVNDFSFMSINNRDWVTITCLIDINHACDMYCYQQMESLKSNYCVQISINQIININESKLISILSIY